MKWHCQLVPKHYNIMLITNGTEILWKAEVKCLITKKAIDDIRILKWTKLIKLFCFKGLLN